MSKVLDDRLRKLELRRETARAGYAPQFLMRWRETADEALARAEAQGITSIGLLLPDGAPSIDEWEREAIAYYATQPKGERDQP